MDYFRLDGEEDSNTQNTSTSSTQKIKRKRKYRSTPFVSDLHDDLNSEIRNCGMRLTGLSSRTGLNARVRFHRLSKKFLR